MGNGSSLGPKDYYKGSKLAQVKGAGSSYHGAAEWLSSRIQAVLGIPTSIYILVSLLNGVANSYESLHQWLSNPFNTSVLLLGIVALCFHGALGVITVINDYIHHKGLNFTYSLFIRLFFGFIVVMCTVSVIFFVLK